MKRDRQKVSEILNGNRIIKSNYGRISVDVNMRTEWHPLKTALIKINHEVDCPIDLSDLWDDKWSAGGKEMSKTDENSLDKARRFYDKKCKGYGYADCLYELYEKSIKELSQKKDNDYQEMIAKYTNKVTELQNIISEKDKEFNNFINAVIEVFKLDKIERIKDGSYHFIRDTNKGYSYKTDLTELMVGNVEDLENVCKNCYKDKEIEELKSKIDDVMLQELGLERCAYFQGFTKNKTHVKCGYKTDKE